MKIGIILNTNDPETTWNAFRFGIEALGSGHSAKIFLLGKGVECENLRNKKFDVQKIISAFKKRNGQILACGTCLKIRGHEESSICPISTMKEMLQLVKESEKILSFG